MSDPERVGGRRASAALRRPAVLAERVASIQAKPKVSDAIINALRHEIASGALELGSRLPTEKALAAHFGVSQPTVREAVRALEVMGLLESRHGSGVYVTRSTHDFVTTTLQTLLQMERVRMLEAFEVRQILGRLSAVKALKHAVPTDVDRLEEAADACDSSTEVQSIAEAIVEFQVAFSAAGHNPLLFALETFLIRLLMQFQLQANGDRGVRFWRRQSDSFKTYRHGLIEALRSQDEQALVDLWNSYLYDQQKLFEQDPALAKITLSDPASIRTVDEIVLNVPTFEFGSR